ncbi:MAG: amidohydrolase family protein [Acidobacteria bacterium]|nr:amidohydrolase family protein [Acidobacteriota bacterium]
MRLVKTLPYCALLLAAYPAWSSLSAADAPQATGSRAVVFEGARLITGDEFLPIENSAFVVENNKFTAVGKKSEVDIPAGAVRVDLTGKTVMPALMELHAHFGYWKGALNTDQNYTRESILDQLDHFAYSGFSAVLSLGVDKPGDLMYRLRDESPLPGKPVLRTAGMGFVNPGSGPSPPLKGGIIEVATEADARKGVQELAAKKADYVKLWASPRGGVPGLPPSIYRAIIDEAHKHKLPVMADASRLVDIKDLLRAGVDGFAHAVWNEREPDDELLEMFKQRPEVFVLTTMTWATRTGYRPAILDEPLFRELYPPDERNTTGNALAKAKREDRVLTHSAPAALSRRGVAKLRAIGVKFALGADFGGTGEGHQFLGVTSHMELENMVAVGFTPAEAIIAGTRNSAEVLGLNELGMVAVGKSADFIVLDANPLDNIANTRRIAKVYLRGTEVNRAALRAKWAGAISSSR